MSGPVCCERCQAPEIVGMWSHDGLPGHEILVCGACWQWLTADDEPAVSPANEAKP